MKFLISRYSESPGPSAFRSWSIPLGVLASLTIGGARRLDLFGGENRARRAYSIRARLSPGVRRRLRSLHETPLGDSTSA